MNDSEYDQYDNLSCEDLLRDLLSEDGYHALISRYGGQQIYVNSLFDPEQFTDILSYDDAKKLVDMFSGSFFALPSARVDLKLLLTILFMQGYTPPEISGACKCTQSYVYRSIRLMIADHPELTALKACYGVQKKSDITNAAPHVRWKSVHRKAHYLEFLGQLQQVPDLHRRAKYEFSRIKTLKNCLPDDPCTPPPFAPWRKPKASADYAPVEEVSAS